MNPTPALKTQRMKVGGMDCTSCALKIETSVEKLPGISEISVVVATGRLIVTYDSQQVGEAEIKQRVTELGYRIEDEQMGVLADRAQNHISHDHGSHSTKPSHDHGSGEFSLMREGVIVGAVTTLFVLGSIFETPMHNTPFSIGEYLVFIPAYLLSGWTVLTSAGRNILRGQVFDENFLMTIATVGAIAIHKLP
jgi:Zn2+/Cd2+-exporting ATPase